MSPPRAVPSGLRPVGSAPAKSHRAQVNRAFRSQNRSVRVTGLGKRTHYAPVVVPVAVAGVAGAAVGVAAVAAGLDVADVHDELGVVAPRVVGRLAAAHRGRHALPPPGGVLVVGGQRALEPRVLADAPRHDPSSAQLSPLPTALSLFKVTTSV
jgi:hypothetical protein